MTQEFIQLYILIAGVYILLVAIFELAVPGGMFTVQRRLVAHPLFRVYGVVLMVFGFPLTQVQGTYFEIMIFILGILVVFMGPVILIYPEKLRKMYHEMEEELSEAMIHRFIRVEGMIRLLVGSIFLINYFVE